ncbi:uncharacterized protein LOC144712881 [Wolffia australiana]
MADSNLAFPKLSAEENERTKLFVGGLAWETRSEALRRYFDPFGEIVEAVVITHKNTGKSKGYGFVTFRDPESAMKACADPNPVIDGRRANCNLASSGRRQTFPSFARVRAAGAHFGLPFPPEAFPGNSGYPQQVAYGFQPGFPYDPYGYQVYGPEVMFYQNMYSLPVGQQFFQGGRGMLNQTLNSQEQWVNNGVDHQPVIQGYGIPSHHWPSLRLSNINASTMPVYSPSNVPVLLPPFMPPPQSPRFPQGADSDLPKQEG